MKRLFYYSTFLFAIFLLSGCSDTMIAGCQEPFAISASDLNGEWQAIYKNERVSDPLPGTIAIIDSKPVLVAPDATPQSLENCPSYEPILSWNCHQLQSARYAITATEMITFTTDGHYLHTFDSEDYHFAEENDHWELLSPSEYGPKIKMFEMTYFVAGTKNAVAKKPIALWHQDSGIDNQPIPGKGSEIRVMYPTAGYVYLYPRMCANKLVLYQMVFPTFYEDLNVYWHPRFERVKQ